MAYKYLRYNISIYERVDSNDENNADIYSSVFDGLKYKMLYWVKLN